MEKYSRHNRLLTVTYNKLINNLPLDEEIIVGFWGVPTVLCYQSTTHNSRKVIQEISKMFGIKKKHIKTLKMKAEDFKGFLDRLLTVYEGEVNYNER